ncbi:uncharacterized protein [Mytilus edulis]|uniref:uncharacterized protein n=1 Tax=Mytilus edulis TaxID=6550 RepID=UPI0039F14C23
MDLAVHGSKGKTQMVVDNGNTSNVHDDDRNVRGTELDVFTLRNHLSGGKSLQLSCAEARVIDPRDDEDLQTLQRDFANLNPKSPLSPPNLDVQTEVSNPFKVQDQLDGKPTKDARSDPRCDPRFIPQTTTRAYQPTDSQPRFGQPSDARQSRGMVAQASGGVRQPSKVQVVANQTEIDQKNVAAQIQKLAQSHHEPWKVDLIKKIVRQYQKAKRCVPVAPDTDVENTFEVPKEKQFQVHVIPDDTPEEDMTITISDDNSFHDIRPESKPSIGNVQPQLRTLSCQPSSADTNDIHPTRMAIEQLNLSNYFRKHEFMKGYVLPGTQESLSHLLRVYTTQPAELAIGCHGILTTRNNQPTELGEYEEFEGFGNGHKFIKIAGKGSYGCVKLCQDNITRMEFVKKEIFKQDNIFLYEVRILSELHHMNIAELYGFVLRDGVPEILMEYAGISLIEYTTTADASSDDLKEDKIIDMLYQGLSALEYLDSKGVIHYDIKPENICILKKESDICLKITDFGSAKKVTEPPDFMGCTVEYLSPELGIQLIASKYQSGVMNLFNYDPADFIISTKSDIFSLALSIMFIYRRGHVVISLFNNGKMSYNGLDAGTINKLRQTILVSLAKNPSLVKTCLIPDACCSEMKCILKDMVEEIPHQRPTATQLKNTMDDVLNRKKTPTVMPFFISSGSFNEDKHMNLTRQLSSKSAAGQNTSYTGAMRGNSMTFKRRISRDHSSLPYGYSTPQKMETNDVEVLPYLQEVVPKFTQM